MIVHASDINTCSLPPIESSTLSTYARSRNIMIGTLINECFNPSFSETNRTICKQLITKEYANLRLSYQNPWSSMEKTQGTVDYSKLDEVIAFAKSINSTIQFYHLIWTNHGRYTNPPAWVFPNRSNTSCGTRTKNELKSIMKMHIQDMIKHGGNTVKVWNVVNEAFDKHGDLVQDCFYKIIGPDYLDKAFQYAREVSPQAILVLNDFFHDIRPGNQKVDGFIQFVKNAKQRGVPIDAVGVQNHLWKNDIDYFGPDYKTDIQSFMDKAKNAGVKVIITEMDVYQKTQSQEDVKRVYKDVTSICLTHTNCLGISTWGTSDKYSWLRGLDPIFIPSTPDPQPLLFDENYARKPAYFGVMEAIRENTTRPCVPIPPNPADLVDTGDTSGDQVNQYDANQLKADFGKTGVAGWIKADINDDGRVDIFDYNELVENFGT